MREERLPKVRGAPGAIACGTSTFLELTNGAIYVGSTDDLRRRVASHQGHVVSTRRRVIGALSGDA